MIIVIGGDSYIGNKLCKYFSEKSELLGGTYFLEKKNGLEYFDLQEPDLSKLDINLSKAKYGIITAAITKIDECKENERKAYKTNVEGTKKLIEQLWQFGITPVFFSSDFVFSGERGDYKEDDERSPFSVYGKQKKIIEDFLSANKKFLIFRLGKIFDTEKGDGTILTETIERLQNNKTIRCAEDQILTLTYIKDLIRVLDLAIEKNLGGLYNVASTEPLSRFEVAKMLKSQLGISSGRIIPCSIKEFYPVLENLENLNISLNTEKIKKATGFEFTKMQTCIEKLKKAYNIE